MVKQQYAAKIIRGVKLLYFKTTLFVHKTCSLVLRNHSLLLQSMHNFFRLKTSVCWLNCSNVTYCRADSMLCLSHLWLWHSLVLFPPFLSKTFALLASFSSTFDKALWRNAVVYVVCTSNVTPTKIHSN